jgi:spermidine synthase
MVRLGVSVMAIPWFETASAREGSFDGHNDRLHFVSSASSVSSAARWLFLIAYSCSGLAGLIYEVSWTRLLTLYIGHTTAAASAVVAAFLGGLAVGAAGGGAVASRLSRRRSLQAYIWLEVGVGVAALLLPLEVAALTPLLTWAYADGSPGWLFPTIRLLSCLALVFVPATALGATFPLAVRWFASDATTPAALGSALYAVNTAGAAAGAVLGGFVLIPTIGLAGTTRLGVAASVLAALAAGASLLADSARSADVVHGETSTARSLRKRVRRSANRAGSASANQEPPPTPRARWLAPAVLGMSGFAALMHEIVWTRILALVLGPTIYAFAGTLAAVIAGIACGSTVGAWLVGRTRRPGVWLAFALAGAAITTTVTGVLAGAAIPRLAAQQIASSPAEFGPLLQQGLLLTGALIVPTAGCLGALFPLALASVSEPSARVAGRFGIVYAVSTIGAVTGSLAAGFVFIPMFGLQTTLTLVSGCLILAALFVVVWGMRSTVARAAAAVATAVAIATLGFSPAWDRELLSSGAYLYAPYVPKDLDLETLLKAGTLLYYREGAASTVSVKRLTGTTTLAVDGKVDASNRSDMLTQKLVAHLPLLLHEHPREVGIIGLGSGVTVGSALQHPIARADVIEISPEVVEASRYFAAENLGALEDPRTNLIVGDGRSHLLLTTRQYDVLISEPSNPWIAGVAALFTREFFEAARARLAPGGIICQWANAYNISNRDLRSIVATFRSVFPDGTLWLVGTDDILLLASTMPIDGRLANLERNWNRPGVAEDLHRVSVLEPFSIWSLFMGGPGELARYAEGSAVLTDDRMTLEFTGPRELHGRSAGENGASLAQLLGSQGGPTIVREARASARAVQWRNRGAMMAKSDAHAAAYDDYVRALTLDPADAGALDGLVQSAIRTRQAADALAWVKGLAAGHAETAERLIATSRLLAAAGFPTDAVDAARQASRAQPVQPAALEQLASLAADAGDSVQLDATVAALQQMAPARAATQYYAAVAEFLRGQAPEAVLLAERAIALDATYAPPYDLLGAAYTRLDKPAEAEAAFQASLRLDAHDSTAYTNLGLLELTAGNRTAARRYFAEALWLDPDSQVAREGIARSR